MASPPSAKLLATLLDEHAAALALYAAQWTDEPDDCVQEAIVELARQRATPDSPVAWLYRVVKRRALNATRSARRREAREREAFRRRLRASGPDPSSAIALADAVARLDEQRREAIVLRVWGGLTLAEVGRTLGVSTATAARRYEQGISELREQWLKANEPPIDHQRERSDVQRTPR